MADHATQNEPHPLEALYAQARATIGQIEYENTELQCWVASFEFESKQKSKLIKALRAVTQDVRPGREERLTVMGRPVSQADVDPQVTILPQVMIITYLNVPFAEKDEVKSLGAQWDVDKKKWYVPPRVDLAPFHRWNWGKKITLLCPFDEKDEAKARGARWDPGDKSWYVTDNMDLEPFKQWLPAPSTPASAGPSSAGTPATVSRKRRM